jgi:hypothetical protein
VNRPTLLQRLRTPNPVEVVQVDITGHPRAATAIARALATVTVVSSMRHRPDSTAGLVRLEVICHPAMSVGGRR